MNLERRLPEIMRPGISSILAINIAGTTCAMAHVDGTTHSSHWPLYGSISIVILAAVTGLRYWHRVSRAGK